MKTKAELYETNYKNNSLKLKLKKIKLLNENYLNKFE